MEFHSTKEALEAEKLKGEEAMHENMQDTCENAPEESHETACDRSRFKPDRSRTCDLAPPQLPSPSRTAPPSSSFATPRPQPLQAAMHDAELLSPCVAAVPPPRSNVVAPPSHLMHETVPMHVPPSPQHTTVASPSPPRSQPRATMHVNHVVPPTMHAAPPRTIHASSSSSSSSESITPRTPIKTESRVRKEEEKEESSQSRQAFMIQEEVCVLNPTWERPKNIEYVGEDLSFTIGFDYMLDPIQMKELDDKLNRNEICMVEKEIEEKEVINEKEENKKEKKEKKIIKENKNTWGKGIDFKWGNIFNNNSMTISEDNNVDEFNIEDKNEIIEELDEDECYEKDVFYAEKCCDPGFFTLPFTIGDSKVIKCLIDTGASFNIMSIELYKSLGLKKLKPTNIPLCLADQTSCFPAGICENVVLAIEDFRFVLDFMILDTPIDPLQPIILGRPFLASGEVEINSFDGTITLHIRGESRTFNMLWVIGGLKYNGNYEHDLLNALSNIVKVEK